MGIIVKKEGERAFYTAALSLFCASVGRLSKLDFTKLAIWLSSTFAERSWTVLASAFPSLYFVDIVVIVPLHTHPSLIG